MKHVHGSILLIFLLGSSGCGKPNPVGARGHAARMPTQKEIDEKHAANFLAGAKDFQNEGRPKIALRTLKELCKQFPNSDAAVEAKQMVAEIEKREAAKQDREPEKVVIVRGLLKHYPQDVKSTKAWLGHEFMIGETPIRPTERVPREALISVVGVKIEIDGVWNAGKTWEPAKSEEERLQLQSPSYPEGETVVRGSGIEAASVKKLEK